MEKKQDRVPIQVEAPMVRGDKGPRLRTIGTVEEIPDGYMAMGADGKMKPPNRKLRRQAVRKARLRAKHRRVGQPIGTKAASAEIERGEE